MNSVSLQPLATGKSVTVTPIRLVGSFMEAAFVRQMPVHSTHYRFVGGMAELTSAALKMCCAPDSRHSVAFVAVDRDNDKETEIGVGCFGAATGNDVRDIAMTVSEESESRDLRTLLAKQLIECARGYGVRQLYSVEPADNAQMRELADELGMRRQADPDDAGLIVYSLAL
jgi:acetyltransferase